MTSIGTWNNRLICRLCESLCKRPMKASAVPLLTRSSLDSLTPRFAVEARAAIQAHLAALFAEEDVQHKQQEISAEDADTPQTDATSPVAIGPAPLPLPVVLSEAEQEELATEHAARHDWIAEEGRQQREVHVGSAFSIPRTPCVSLC